MKSIKNIIFYLFLSAALLLYYYMAMLDALDLSNCLTNRDFLNLDDAIAAYEKIMFDRAAPLSIESIGDISDFAAPTEESVKELIKMLS